MENTGLGLGYSWGYNKDGQLVHGFSTRKPTLISFFEGMNVMNVFAFYHQSFVLLRLYYFFNFQIYKIMKFIHLVIILAAIGSETRRECKYTQKDKCFPNEKIINIAGGGEHTFFIISHFVHL